MKVIVTAGGTGGHIYPALGVIEQLESIGAEILYIGTKNRMESTLIPEKGINYVGLEIYGLSKTNILRDIKNVGYIIKSYNTCKKIMKEFKPDYVIGFGGYVTLPVLLAAKNAKIRCGIHEQNKLPGKTNKFLSKYVDETFTSFEVSDKTFKNKVIVTGNPTGSKALNIKPADKTKLGFSKDKKLTIIVMGSLGSQIVNNLLKDFLTNYKNSDNEILFITGKSNYENFKDNCKKIETSIKKEATLEKNRIVKETLEKCKKKELDFENKLKKKEEEISKVKANSKVKEAKKTVSSKNKSSKSKRKK